MILLFWGTVAQKNMGLYQAQEKFFSSWILWLGPLQTPWLSLDIQIPSPGGRSTMALITLGLIFKIFFASSFKKRSIGILITHLGSLMLLGGGVLTAYFSSEGSLVLDEGATSGIYQDYHLHELAVIDTRPQDVDQITSFSGHYLNQGAQLTSSSLPFKLEVLAFYPNVKIFQKTTPVKETEKGMAQRFEFKNSPLDADDNKNRAGIQVLISGLDAEQDGEYLLYEYMEVPQSLRIDGKPLFMGLRKKHYQLPFEIELLDFEKQVHPGTGMARSYKSDVHVVKDGSKRKVTISMNKPLRTEGYTLYQASFSQMEGRETSVLTVVQNVGRLFPYISSIIICIGILIHLVLQLPTLIRRA
jgi:cytochrome c biogenesis protein ResB